MADEELIEEAGTDRERVPACLHKKRDFQGHLVVYLRAPITEDEIRREIDRLHSPR